MSTDLIAYAPKLAAKLSGNSALSPAEKQISGCLLFADLSGFTFLAHKLSKNSSTGAERVQQVLNEVFTPIVENTHVYGGDIISFPGDAVIAIWTSATDEASPEVALAATAAATEIQKAMGNMAILEEVQLHLRIVLSVGKLNLMRVGGLEASMHFLVGGMPIQEVNSLMKVARPGEIICSKGFQKLVAEASDTEIRTDCFRIVSCDPAPKPEVGGPALDVESLQTYIPHTVRHLRDAGKLNWLAEFRHVTTLFANISDPDASPDDLENLQTAAAIIQSTVARYGGAVNQLVIDNHGLVLVVAFGTLNFVHEDGASRAIYTGIELQSALESAGLNCRIGISTGQVFVGQRGSRERLELALIGHSVNMAARLMAISEGVVCDAVTQAEARQRFYFEALPPVQLKGIAEDTPVFRPQSTKESGLAKNTILGREADCDLIDGILSDLENANKGGLVLVRGSPGIGKTELLNYVLEKSQSSSVRVLKGAADSIESNSPFFALRPIVFGLLGISPKSPTKLIEEKIQEYFPSDSSLKTGLLSPVLSLSSAENERVSSMKSLGRADAVCDAILELFEANVQKSSMLLIIEDAHWLDGATAYFMERLLESMPNILVMISQRAGTENKMEIPSGDHVNTINLKELNRDDSTTLLCRYLDVDSVEAEIANYVFERSGGQPLFIEQLARALRDQSSIKVVHGICSLVSSDTLEKLDLPHNISGVITATLDQLSLDQQHILKAASVFGLQFNVDQLARILRDGFTKPELLGHLQEIEAATLITPSEEEYRFKHALIQLSIYNLLASEQKREFHLAIGLQLEADNADDYSHVCSLLAHHFVEGDDKARAINYIEIAGNNALHRDHANADAIKYFQQLIDMPATSKQGFENRALKLPNGTRTNSQSARLAGWHLSIGEAEMRNGLTTECSESFTRALSLLGQSFPMSKTRILGVVLSGMMSRMLVKPKYPSLHSEDPTLIQAIQCAFATYDLFARLTYTIGKPMYGVACSFRGLILAEYLGPSPEYCTSYSMMSNVMAITTRFNLAKQYSDLAAQVATDIGDETSIAASNSRAILFKLQLGDKSVGANFLKASTIYAELGDYHESSMARISVARTAFMSGDYETPGAIYEKALLEAKRARSIATQCWALTNMGELMYRKDQMDRAQRYCTQATEVNRSNTKRVDYGGMFQNEGVLALISLHNKQHDAAWEHANNALIAHDNGGWLSFMAGAGYMGILEVMLSAIQQNGAESQKAKKVFTRLSRKLFLSKSRRVVLPLHYYYAGVRNRQLGKNRSANKILRKGLSLADGMKMPYEKAIILHEISKVSESEHVRMETQNEAIGILQNIGAQEQLRKISVEYSSH